MEGYLEQKEGRTWEVTCLFLNTERSWEEVRGPYVMKPISDFSQRMVLCVNRFSPQSVPLTHNWEKCWRHVDSEVWQWQLAMSEHFFYYYFVPSATFHGVSVTCMRHQRYTGFQIVDQTWFLVPKRMVWRKWFAHWVQSRDLLLALSPSAHLQQAGNCREPQRLVTSGFRYKLSAYILVGV